MGYRKHQLHCNNHKKIWKQLTPATTSVPDCGYIQQFTCTICEKCFISKEFLAKHISSSHTGAETFNIGIVNFPADAVDFAANSGVDSIENIEISFKAISELPQTHEVDSKKDVS